MYYFYNQNYFVTIANHEFELINELLKKVKRIEPKKHVRLSTHFIYRLMTLYISYLKRIDKKMKTIDEQMSKSTRNKQLYELLQKLNIDSEWYELLKNGVLKDTTFNPTTQSFVIHIHFTQQVKPNLYFAILEIKNKLKYNSTFKLTFENQNITLEYLKEILSNVILKRYENMVMSRALLDTDIEMDETNFYFYFDSPIQVEKFEKFRSEIESIYNFLGVNKKLIYKTKLDPGHIYYKKLQYLYY